VSALQFKNKYITELKKKRGHGLRIDSKCYKIFNNINKIGDK
jgi:hypothetical protein